MRKRVEVFLGGVKDTMRLFNPNRRVGHIVPTQDGGTLVFSKEGFSDDCEVKGKYGLFTVFVDTRGLPRSNTDIVAALIDQSFEKTTEEKMVFGRTIVDGQNYCQLTVDIGLLDREHASEESDVGILANGNNKAFVRQELTRLLQSTPVKVTPMSLKRWNHILGVLYDFQSRYLELVKKTSKSRKQ